LAVIARKKIIQGKLFGHTVKKPTLFTIFFSIHHLFLIVNSFLSFCKKIHKTTIVFLIIHQNKNHMIKQNHSFLINAAALTG